MAKDTLKDILRYVTIAAAEASKPGQGFELGDFYRKRKEEMGKIESLANVMRYIQGDTLGPEGSYGPPISPEARERGFYGDISSALKTGVPIQDLVPTFGLAQAEGVISPSVAQQTSRAKLDEAVRVHDFYMKDRDRKFENEKKRLSAVLKRQDISDASKAAMFVMNMQRLVLAEQSKKFDYDSRYLNPATGQKIFPELPDYPEINLDDWAAPYGLTSDELFDIDAVQRMLSGGKKQTSKAGEGAGKKSQKEKLQEMLNPKK